MLFPSEFAGIHSLSPENPTLCANNYGTLMQNLFTPQSSCISNNSTSDEGDEFQLSIINQRKQRRTISNRESARRSRLRKQKHLDELWSHLDRLRTVNHELIDKLNHVAERHGVALEENARLKEETSDLRQMLADVQLASTYNALRDL